MLADLGMPGSDGFDLLHRARDLAKKRQQLLPVLAVTAYASENDRARAFDAGFDGYLSKPVDPAVLVRTLIDLIGFTGSGRAAVQNAAAEPLH